MAEEKQSCAFRTSIGGQALIEGIMMRGPEKQAIVVRDQEGNLVEKVEDLKFIKDRYPILGVPLIRGTVNFLAAMVNGVKAIRAQTRVGSVRTRLRNRRTINTTTRFVTILLAARMAKGTASTAPMKEPRIDILMVSHKGPQIFGRYSVFGGNICQRISKNFFPLAARIEKLKPVIWTETAVQIRTISRISGNRAKRSSTTLPFGSSSLRGLKMRS